MFRNELAFGGYRMRFASALATDLNENGVPRSSSWPFITTATAATEDVGWMDFRQEPRADGHVRLANKPSTSSARTYGPTKQVDALDDVYVQYEMCRPAALATGKFQRDQRNELFVEGCVFTLSSDGGNPASTEADLFRNGDFSSRYRMVAHRQPVTSSKALNGNFAKTNIGTEQLIVQAVPWDRNLHDLLRRTLGVRARTAHDHARH